MSILWRHRIRNIGCFFRGDGVGVGGELVGGEAGEGEGRSSRIADLEFSGGLSPGMVACLAEKKVEGNKTILVSDD